MTSGGDDGNSWDKDTLPKKHCMDGSCTGIALEEHEPVSPSSTTKGVNELQHNSGYHTLSPNNKDLCLFYHQGSKKCSVHPDSYTKNSKATVAAAPNISKRHSRQPKESDVWGLEQQKSSSPFQLACLLLVVSALASLYNQRDDSWAVDKQHILPLPYFPPSFHLPSSTQASSRQKQQGSYLSNLLTYTYQPPRESKTTFIATATLKHHLQSMTSNVVSGVPLATDQSHKHALSQQHQQQFSNANGHPGQEREFFDPMVGRFSANPSTPYDSFFNSKIRWRGELELAEYAWSQERQVNMLRTEQIRSGRAASSNSAGANSGPLTGIQQTEAQQQQQGGSRPRNDDPSLMDYEAIDVYWRRDIEQEKGSFYAHPNNQGQQQHQQQQHMTMDSATEQYERDLQLLTEKSLFVPLNSEERYRYENLSKAHYSDFYRALGQPLQASAKQKGLSQVREGIATTSSGKSLGGESLILTDLSYNQPTSSSNPRSTANVVQRQTNIKNEVFSDYDEDKPEDFFRYLAKESVDNEPLPILGVTTAASAIATAELIDPIHAFSNNVTLCSPNPVLLNNVSLSEAVPVNSNNMTDVFATNLSAASTNTTMSSMFNLPQSSSILGLDAASNNTRNSTDFSVNSTMMANDSFSRSITDYGFARGLNETFSSVFNNQTLTFADNYNSSTGVANSNVAIPAAEYFNFSIYNNSAGVFAVDSNNRRDGGASPSSGIGSMCSSSSSPRSLEDSAPLTSRIQNKLVPVIENEENVVVVAYPDASTTRINDRVLSQIQAVNASVQPRRRGRQSKDEQLVNDNGLPATADQITMMTHQEIQKMMRDPKLSAAQKALIKKIRRRGRNKVAARKCRERRVPTAADGSVAYNNTFYDHPEMEQNKMSEDMYMDGTHFSNYSGPSTSKQSTSSYYHNNLRF